MCALPSKKNWVPPSNAVLKLRVGETEIRRVQASAFIKDGNLVYRALVKKVAKFAGLEESEDIDVKTTYVDEDGDTITFSCASEFADAWKNNQEKVFRVTATVNQKRTEVKEVKQEVDYEHDTSPSRLGGRRGGRFGGKGRPLLGIRVRLNKLETQVESIIKGMKNNPDLDKILSNVEDINKEVKDENCAEMLEETDQDLEGVACKVVVESSTSCDASREVHNGVQCDGEVAAIAGPSFVNKNVGSVGTNMTEVHVNVQCDGCNMWPIRGARYQASNKVNYDICEKCYSTKNYPGELTFIQKKGIMCPDVFGKLNNKHSGCGTSISKPTKVSCTEAKRTHFGIACDGCEMSPILGDRFRAINMADYDLCEKCHSSSATNLPEIEFEKISDPVYVHHYISNVKETVSGEMKSKPQEPSLSTYNTNDKVCKVEAVSSMDIDVKGTVSDEMKTKSESSESIVDANDEKCKVDDISSIKSSKNSQEDTLSSNVSEHISPHDREAVSSKMKNNDGASNDKVLLQDEKKLSMAPDSRPEVHFRFSCDGCLMRPIVGPRYRATNGMDFDLCQDCHSSNKIPDVEFERVRKNITKRCPFIEANNPTKSTLEEKTEFIHGRHTCDGCMMTPIIGLRYNALNLPDYDLCSNCYAKYDGNEIVFEVAELDRDRSRQAMWKMKAKKGLVKSFEERRNKASRNANEKEEKMSSTPVVEKKENELTEVIGQALDESAKAIGTFVKELADVVEKKQGEDVVELPQSKKSGATKSTGEESTKQPEGNVVVKTSDDDIVDLIEHESALGDVKPLPREVNEENSLKGMSEISSLPSLDLLVKDSKTEPYVDDTKEADGLTDAGSVDGSLLENKESKDYEEVSVAGNNDVESTSNKSKKSGDIVNITIDQDEDADEKSCTTDDEWDVLDDVAQQIESDAALARAASLVGSALFEDSQKDSYVVPRWNSELAQLHELGFFDDRRSVDILDSIKAANIGSNESSAIKIETVVERLLRKD